VLDSRPTDEARTETLVIDEPTTPQPGAEGPGHAEALADPDSMAFDVPPDLDSATAQALLTLPGRSPDPVFCPFLRAGAGTDGPPDAAATAHRCEAVLPPVAVGDRQRQLLCQVATHPTCPRYLRGEAGLRAALAPGLGQRGRAAPIAIGTAVVLLVAAAAVAVSSGIGSVDGDVAGGGAASTPSSAASSRATAAPIEGGAAPQGSSGAPPPTVVPVATVRPTLVATADLPTPWRGLEPCPAPDSCYLYVVQRRDTFSAIAARFETTVKKLRRLNPGLTDPSSIRVGSTLRVPPPSS
jgi:LysM domain